MQLMTVIMAVTSLNTLKAYRDRGYPNRITCFTCNNATSNDECNLLAVDRPCPNTLQTCITQHTHTLGRTFSVKKFCGNMDECMSLPGCYRDGLLQMCISCCDKSYCNEKIPWTLDQVENVRSTATSIIPHLSLKLLLFTKLFMLIIK